MCLIIALGVGSAPDRTIAHWRFTYPYSGNLENDRVYTHGERLYYERTAIDRATGLQTPPSVIESMPIDNMRDVSVNETTTEIHVQVWGILNTFVLVLHFTKAQSQPAHHVARELEALEFSVYLPMQNRAKIPVSSSSFATSPVS